MHTFVHIIDPPSKQPIIRKFNSIKISFSRDNPYLLLPPSKILLLSVPRRPKLSSCSVFSFFLVLPLPLSLSLLFRKKLPIFLFFTTTQNKHNPPRIIDSHALLFLLLHCALHTTTRTPYFFLLPLWAALRSALTSFSTSFQ